MTSETSSYRYAEQRIADLLDEFKAKGICKCCIARALLFVGAGLCEVSMGSAGAAGLFADLSDVARQHNRPAPEHSTRH
jgi:hypothetical protein